MSELHPEALALVRERHPSTVDDPDEALARTAWAAWASFELHARDLGRAYLAAVEREAARARRLGAALRRGRS